MKFRQLFVLGALILAACADGAHDTSAPLTSATSDSTAGTPVGQSEQTAPPTSTPALATPPASPDVFHGNLLFSRTIFPDDQALFLLTESGEQQLSEFGESCCVMAISPDRREILVMPGTFGSPLNGATLDLETGKLAPLTVVDPTLNLVPTAWSPDGKRIAFLGFDDADPSRRGIYTANADDGAELLRVTTRPGALDDVPLEYSPDGEWLLFYRAVAPDPDPQVGGSLWVIRIDGTDPHPIAEASALPASVAGWSPDGERIVYGNERTAESGALWTVRPDGTERTEVFSDSNGGFPIAPIWSPDGSQIMFALDPTNDQFTHPPNELYVIDADGANPQLVLGGDDFKRLAAWW